MTAEQEALIKRLVTNPSLVSDGTLRAALASVMRWEIDASYWTDQGQPWAHGHSARVVNTRLDDLEDQVSLIRGHLVL